MSPAVVLGHLLVPRVLPVAPVVVATIALLVLAVAALVPSTADRRPPPARHDDPLGPPPWAPRTRWVLARLAGIVLLALVLAAGLVAQAPLASTLVVSVSWPLLLMASALGGQVWRWINPFDTVARPLERLTGEERVEEAAPPVVWAIVPALGWLYLLNLPISQFQPRTVATALANYTVFALAGCLLLGRRAWLLRAEVFGLLFTWVGHMRRGALTTWWPPRAADLLLGVLAGGLLVSAFRLSALWPLLPRTAWAPWYPLIGVLLGAATGAVVTAGMDRWAGRLGASGSVTAAMVPAVAVTAIAVALANQRLLLAVQALPGLMTDPFGRGWDPVGAADWAIRRQLLGDGPLALLQVLILVAGAVAGVSIARARAGSPRGHQPAAVTVGTVLAFGVLAVTAV